MRCVVGGHCPPPALRYRPHLLSWTLCSASQDVGHSVSRVTAPGTQGDVASLPFPRRWPDKILLSRGDHLTSWIALKPGSHFRPSSLSLSLSVYIYIYIYIYTQWNLYKAEPHGTENIFHSGQISALYKTNNTDSFGRTIEFVHIEQISALFKFRLIQVSLYIYIVCVYVYVRVFAKVKLTVCLTNEALCHEDVWGSGWVGPVPDPLLLRKSGSAGNRTRASRSVARNSDH
jgi:hypothetical protein